jgi:hypothetical protein
MKHLKRLEEEVSAWPQISVHAHALAAENSVSEAQRSGTCTRAAWLTYPFRFQFAMLS